MGPAVSETPCPLTRCVLGLCSGIRSVRSPCLPLPVCVGSCSDRSPGGPLCLESLSPLPVLGPVLTGRRAVRSVPAVLAAAAVCVETCSDRSPGGPLCAGSTGSCGGVC